MKCLCECLHARACTGLSRNGGGGASLFYAERGARSIYAHHMALLVSADGIRCRTAATSSAKIRRRLGRYASPLLMRFGQYLTLTLVIYTRSVPCVAARSNRALPASAAGAAQRYPSAQPLAWPRALTHGLARSHAQRRAARARVAPAPQRPRHSIALITPAPSTALGADAREPTLVAARRRSISRHSSRATRPPAFLRRLHPETSRHRTRESLEIMLRLLLVALPLVVALPAAFDKPELHAFQFEAQSPLQFKVRSPPESRPLRPAATRAQHYSPATAHSTPHAHHPPSAHITMDAPRHTRMRARRSTPRSTSSSTSSPPRDTNPPSTGVPPSPAGRHACGAASVGPAAARARPVRMLKAHAHEAARVRCPLPRLPDSVDSAPAARRDATCDGHRHLRARRLACFADGLRVAPPVQAAAAARGRARRPPRPRHLRHDRQARRRHHGHEDPAAVTPAGSAAWPGGAKPVPVIRARSSSRLRPRRRTARPAHHRVRPRRFQPSHRRHANQGVATPPLATGPPPPLAVHTHPCSIHIHLHRMHHALTSPPDTCSPLPLHRPCPS